MEQVGVLFADPVSDTICGHGADVGICACYLSWCATHVQDSVNRATLLALLCAPGVDTSIRNAAGESAEEVCRRCSGYDQLFRLAEPCLRVDS